MANHRKLTRHQELEAVKMYTEENMSVAAVSREFGVNRETLNRLLKRHGVAPSPRGAGKLRKLPQVTVDYAVSLYLNGSPCEQVAVDFGVAPETITRWVREAGGAVRPAGFLRGKAHHGWKGGVIPNPDGYLLERVDESDPLFVLGQKKAGNMRYALQHRLVMARHLGRPLEPHETVHHIDGNIQNNAIENLQLRNGKHGKGVALCCADCGSTNIIKQELN